MLYNLNWDVKVPDLTKPSLEGLAYLLRRKDLWPKGFVWDWGKLNHCAIGLAARHWKLQCTSTLILAGTFGIKHNDVFDLFMKSDKENPLNTQPEYITELIERYLDQHR